MKNLESLTEFELVTITKSYMRRYRRSICRAFVAEGKNPDDLACLRSGIKRDEFEPTNFFAQRAERHATTVSQCIDEMQRRGYDWE